MKKFLLISVLLAVLCCALAFVGCDALGGRLPGSNSGGDSNNGTESHTEHNMQFVPAQEATCLQEGHKAHWYCSECSCCFLDQEGANAVLPEDLWFPILDHNLEWVVEKEPGCEQPGWSVQRCTMCNGEFGWQETPAKEHDFTFHKGFDATCTEDGLYDYWYCSLCNNYYYGEKKDYVTSEFKDLSIPAMNHQYVHSEQGYPATCTTDGVVWHVVCDLCGANLVQDETGSYIVLGSIVIPAFNHDGSTIYNEGIEVDCFQDGRVENWFCTLCNTYFADEELTQTLTYEQTVVECIAHRNMQHVSGVSATMVTDGTEEYWYCPDCHNYCADDKFSYYYQENIFAIPALLQFTLASDGESYIISGSNLTEKCCLELPSVYNGLPVTAIGDGAFRDDKEGYLTGIVLPESITSIGGGAFCVCSGLVTFSLTDVEINISDLSAWCGVKFSEDLFDEYKKWTLLLNGQPANNITINEVEEIAPYAFKACNSLSTVTVRGSVTNIGTQAFAYSSVQTCSIGGVVSTIGEDAFAGSSLTSVTMGNSLRTIGQGAFQNCKSLTTVAIGNGLQTIEQLAFCNSKAIETFTIDWNRYTVYLTDEVKTVYCEGVNIAMWAMEYSGLCTWERFVLE